jgi:hypothetical protein
MVFSIIMAWISDALVDRKFSDMMGIFHFDPKVVYTVSPESSLHVNRRQKSVNRNMKDAGVPY